MQDNHPTSPIIPSMMRRKDNHDYTGRGIYMITMAIEGRKPIIGRITGNPEAPDGSPEAPHILLSPLGRCIQHELHAISIHCPQLQLLKYQLMPDHIHFILYVKEQLPYKLGYVINGFKAGCRKAIRNLSEAENIVHCETADHATTTQATTNTTPQKSTPPLWEKGYHDRILIERNQLQQMTSYIHDNPRRLLLKRANSQYFHQQIIHIDGTRIYAYGNIELLQKPDRIAVKCSRNITQQQLEAQGQTTMARCQNGAVLVSPFISKGERQIEQAALDHGACIIKLLDTGFSPLYKPWGKWFDLCTTGRLLLLSPYEYNTQRTDLSRNTCMQLNALALKIGTPL